MQVRAFMEVASEIKYEYLKKVKIWKGKIGDEGVRFICKYLSTANSLDILDLMNNGITALGCEFLGKALTSPLVHLTQLKLDDNSIHS
jgi:Ran GTPase-activating protein (RanGAP) involved in mRNA processing and transport